MRKWEAKECVEWEGKSMRMRKCEVLDGYRSHRWRRRWEVSINGVF